MPDSLAAEAQNLDFLLCFRIFFRGAFGGSHTSINIIIVQQRLVTTLSRSDSNHIVYRVDKDHSIARVACASSLDNRLDGLFDIVVAKNDVELILGQ
jgi:hypothetical protein